MTCLYCVVCGDPTGGDKTCSRECSETRERDAQNRARAEQQKLDDLFPGIEQAVLAWCAANGCTYSSLYLMLGDTCRVTVRVGRDHDCPLIGSVGATTGAVINGLNRLNRARADRWRPLRLIRGGRA